MKCSGVTLSVLLAVLGGAVVVLGPAENRQGVAADLSAAALRATLTPDDPALGPQEEASTADAPCHFDDGPLADDELAAESPATPEPPTYRFEYPEENRDTADDGRPQTSAAEEDCAEARGQVTQPEPECNTAADNRNPEEQTASTYEDVEENPSCDKQAGEEVASDPEGVEKTADEDDDEAETAEDMTAEDEAAEDEAAEDETRNDETADNEAPDDEMEDDETGDQVRAENEPSGPAMFDDEPDDDESAEVESIEGNDPEATESSLSAEPSETHYGRDSGYKSEYLGEQPIETAGADGSLRSRRAALGLVADILERVLLRTVNGTVGALWNTSRDLAETEWGTVLSGWTGGRVVNPWGRVPLWLPR